MHCTTPTKETYDTYKRDLLVRVYVEIYRNLQKKKNMARRTYGWVMSRRWRSHVSHGCESSHTCEESCESCNTYEWVWMSHITHTDESCLACVWVISHVWRVMWVMLHIWMSLNESCDTYEWVWMSHVTHTDESCLTWVWGISHMWRVMWVMWHIWMSLNESCNT